MKNIKVLVFGALALTGFNLSAQETAINKTTVSSNIEAMLADNLSDIKISVNPTVVTQVSRILVATTKNDANEESEANRQTANTATVSE